MNPVSSNGNHFKSYLPFPLEMEKCGCAICLNKDAKTLLTFDSFGFPTRTVECLGCGLVYVNRRPTPDFMQRFYAKYYWFYAEGFRKFSERYINEKMWRERAQARVIRYGDFISEGARILDVGCGAGLFLDQARKKVPSAAVFGIEPDSKMADFCTLELGIDTYNGFFNSFPSSGQFDVVSAFHVIEHLFDLPEFLGFLRLQLRDRGVAIIETPNVAGGWSGIGMFHLSHLYTFSPRTITNLFLKHGFEILKSEPLENDLDQSNLYLVARKSEKLEQMSLLPLDERESERIVAKCKEIRNLRATRVVRNWAKMAYFGVRNQIPQS